MKLLVVFFAVFGIIGTGGLAYLVGNVLFIKNTPEQFTKEIDTQIAYAESMPAGIEKEEKLASLEAGKQALQFVVFTLYTFAGSALLGLLISFLVITNLGPGSFLQGFLLILIGIAPILMTFLTLDMFTSFMQVTKFSGGFTMGSELDFEKPQNIILLVSAASGGFVLAGFFALFIKRSR